MNYPLIAVQVGDALKYATSVNEIDRIGGAVLKVTRESFPNDAITSQRAKRIHDWVLSLAKTEMSSDERVARLVKLCRELAPDQEWPRVSKVLADAGISKAQVNRDNYNLFMSRGFHEEVIRHAQTLFMDSHFFHAVFEAAKVYNESGARKGSEYGGRSDPDAQGLGLGERMPEGHGLPDGHRQERPGGDQVPFRGVNGCHPKPNRARTSGRLADLSSRLPGHPQFYLVLVPPA
jgi:hypothetical protein